MGEMLHVYKISIVKHTGKRSLARHRRRREDNTKMDLKEISCDGVDWLQVAQDRPPMARY